MKADEIREKQKQLREDVCDIEKFNALAFWEIAAQLAELNENLRFVGNVLDSMPTERSK